MTKKNDFMGFGFAVAGRVGVVLVAVLMLANSVAALNLSSPTGCVNSVCTVSNGEVITGVGTNLAIRINHGATITLKNAILTNTAASGPAIQVGTGTDPRIPEGRVKATIKLEGTNILMGGIGAAGIRVSRYAELTIEGDGELSVFGGESRYLIRSAPGAGIGGGFGRSDAATVADNGPDDCGKVTINGGIVNAYAGALGQQGTELGFYAAGIGGSGRGTAYTAGQNTLGTSSTLGGNGEGCDLTINGGTVTAVGGHSGNNDIGGGAHGNTASSANYASHKGVTINGGSVNASIRNNGTNISVSIPTFTTNATRVNGANNSATPVPNASSTTAGANNGYQTTGNDWTWTYIAPDSTIRRLAGVSASTTVTNGVITINSGGITTTYTASASCPITGHNSATTAIWGACTAGSVGNLSFGYGNANQCGANNRRCVRCTEANGCNFTVTLVTTVTSNKPAVSNSSGTQVTRRDFTIGAIATNTETENKGVVACRVGNLECDIDSPPASGKYGIKDVQTDINRQLHFWLAGNGQANDFIKLNFPPDGKTYDWTTGNTFKGPPPSMTRPGDIPNSLVGETVDGKEITGPYKTQFRMRGIIHYAAVGTQITMIKGDYISNDAGEEAGSGTNTKRHMVRWCRSDSQSQSSCTVIDDVPTTDGNQVLSNTIKEVKYTPRAVDYGRYIWAEVLVKDADDRVSANYGNLASDWVTSTSAYIEKYPVIQVGVVVRFEKDRHPSVDEGILNNTNGVITKGNIPDTEGLFLPQSGDVTSVGASASISGVNTADYTFEWKAVSCKDRDNETTAPQGICKSGRMEYQPSNVSPIGTDIQINPITFNLPAVSSCNSTSCAVPGDTVYLVATIISGKRPEPTNILFKKENGTNAVSITVEKNSALYSSEKISKAGTIVITFSEALSEEVSGTVTLSNTVLDCVPEGSTVTCSYLGLNPGGRNNTLTVKGYNNTNRSGMLEFNLINILVEDPASLTWPTTGNTHYASKDFSKSNFIIGARENIVGQFNYDSRDAGNIEGFCYKWQIEETQIEGSEDLYCNDGDSEEPESTPTVGAIFQSASSGTAVQVPAPAQTLQPGDFGKYIRLVVRPKGFNPISGTKYGHTVADPTWQRIGVLLKGGIDTENPKTYTNVTFKGCDAEGNPDSEGIIGCQADGSGFMVYTNGDRGVDAIRLSVTLRDKYEEQTDEEGNTFHVYTYYQLDGWHDDFSPVRNECGVSGSDDFFFCNESFQYSNYFVKTPSKGIITITPLVIPITVPVISNAKILNKDGNQVDLKIDNLPVDERDIKVISNTLSITFSKDIDDNFEGTVRLVSGDREKSFTVKPTTKRSLTLTLPLEDDVFGGIGKVFGKNYKIIVSGFQDDNKNRMETESFTFTTAEGPSVKEDPKMETDYFAVGHTIRASELEYKQNGGNVKHSTEGYIYCWQEYSSPNQSLTADCKNTTNTDEFYVESEYYGTQIRLTVRAKDSEDREGTPIATAPEKIGVVLKMAATDGFKPNYAKGTTQTVYIGSSENVYSYNSGTSDWDKTEKPEVAYGQTTIRWSPSGANNVDKIVKWNAPSGIFAPEKEVTTYTPSSPAGDIEFKLEIDNGEPLYITPSYTTQGGNNGNVTLKFKEEDVYKANNAVITITRGEKVWTYTNNSGTDLTGFEGYDKKTLVIPFSSFGDDYEVTQAIDVLGISADAFCDKSNNCTAENSTLALLSGAQYFLLAITPRSEVIRGDYGTDISPKTISITHSGNRTTEDLKATLEVCKEVNYNSTTKFCVEKYDKIKFSNSDITGGSFVDVNNININAMSSASSASFNVAPDQDIDAGTYIGKVSIGCQSGSSCEVSEEILLTFTVAKKQLYLPTSIALSKDTIYYNGGKTITGAKVMENGIDWVFNKATQATSFDKDVANTVDITNSVSFSDAFAGRNKPIEVVFRIEGTKVANYGFGAGGNDETTISSLRGTINQKPLDITFTNASLGTKPFNGLYEFENEFIKNPPILGTEYTLAGKVNDNDNVVIDFDNSVFNLASQNQGTQGISGTRTSSIALGGDDAGNYEVGTVDFAGLTGTIDGISIANSLDPNTACKSATDCKIIAELTYGDRLAYAYPSNESHDVFIKDIGSLGGTWAICVENLDGNFPEECGQNKTKPSAHIVSPTDDASKEVYAYFAARSSNYKRDLVVGPIDFKIAPKPITISADLSQAGNKVYDGTVGIDATKVKASNETRGLLEDDKLTGLLTSVTASSATFENPNAGNNKYLTINWDLVEGSEAWHKYTAGPTVTLGSIAKRKVSLEVPAPPTKYYDASKAITVDPATLRLQTQTSDAGILNADAAAATLNIKSPDVVFEFFNPSAGNDKPITSNGGPSDFLLLVNGSENANYELVLDELKGNILPASLADVLCKQIEGATCPGNTEAEKNAWLTANKTKIVAQFQTTRNAELSGVYGQPLSEIQNLISTIMPNTLGELFGAKIGDLPDQRPVTWAWSTGEGAKYVGDVGPNKTKTTGEAYFVHGDPNYETGITVPIPVTATTRQLTATLVPENRDYDTTEYVNIRVIPGNVFFKDDVALVALGKTANANADGDKPIIEIVPPGIRWSTEIDQRTRDNYTLPRIEDEYNQVSPKVNTLKVSIAKIEWPDAITPQPTESSFVYDLARYPNLASIGFLQDGWTWDRADETFPDPNEYLPANLQSLDSTYLAVFAPPANMAANYRNKEERIKLTIIKRSEDNSVSSAVVNTVCGTDTASVTVRTTNAFAEVWYNNTSYGISRGTFPVSGLAYGGNLIPYEVQAQAYNVERFRKPYLVNSTRYLPFAKVAGWVRDKALTITLDSSQLAEQEFFRKYEWDIPRTQWYKDSTVIGTGRNLAVNQSTGDDYWVRMYTKDGEIFQSCKLRGGAPDIVPIMPGKNGVKLIAHSFTTKVVAGGTTLTIDTPFGSKISIYTMKGELVSKINAVENRTVVKVPKTNGMYIVKLENK